LIVVFWNGDADRIIIMALSKWTKKARKAWEQMSEEEREEIAQTSWCPHYNFSGRMKVTGAKVFGEQLVLMGVCSNCGGDVAQAVQL